MSDGLVDYGQLEFQVRRWQLQHLVEFGAAVLPSRPTQQVYGCFRAEVSPGRLRLTAADGQMTVLAELGAVATEDTGTVFLPGAKLQAYLSAAPDVDMTVRVRKNFATVAAAGTEWQTRLPPPDGYPEVLDPAEVDFARLPREPLLAALKAVRHAAGRDQQRPAHTQVHIAKDGDEMFATAYDGSQYARAPVPGFPIETDLPTVMLDPLVKLLDKDDSPEVEVAEHERAVVFRVGDVVFSCLKMATAFPDLDQLVRQPVSLFTDQAQFDRDELLGAVKRAAINAHRLTSAIALIFADGSLTISAHDDDENNAQETVQATWAGARRLLAVNWRFLVEMLSVHPVGVCTLRFGENIARELSMVALESGESRITVVIPQMLPTSMGYR